MRSFTVLALIAIVSSAFAVHLSPKQTAFISLTNELKANNSPLSKTITGLLSLRQDVNDNSEVVDALNVLRNELEQIESQTKDLYDQATQNHDGEAGRLEDLLEQIEAALADNNNQLQAAQDDLAQTEDAINNNEQILDDTNQQIQDIEDTRAAEHDQYLTQTADIAAALDAFGEAITIIQAIGDEDLNSTGFESFLQTATEKLKVQMNKIEARLKRSKTSSSFLKALVQIMAKGVNQAVVDNILGLLSDAVGELTATAAGIEDLEQTRLAAFTDLHATLVDRRDLTIDALNNLHQHESDLNNTIDALNDAIANLEQNENDVQNAIDTEAAAWAQTVQGYEGRIARADSDIDLIDKAIVRLQA